MRWMWVFFLALFSGFLGYLNVMTLAPVQRSVQAATYPRVSGTMDGSRVVSYHYEVKGQSYTGRRYRYQGFGTSDQQWIEAYLDQHPAGTPVTVRYNPANPADCVLEAGLEGSDLLMVMLLTPFNAIVLALWLQLSTGRRFAVWERGPSLWWRVATALRGAVTVAGCMSLPACLFLVMMVGFRPSLALAAATCGVILCVSTWLTITTFVQPLVEGVVLDRDRRTLTLYTQGQARTIPFGEVSGLVVKRLDARLHEVLIECGLENVALTTSEDRAQVEKDAGQLAEILRVPVQNLD